MSLQSWQETLVSQQAAGGAFNTFTTAKTVINPQALVVLPAGFWIIGKTMRIRVAGSISNIVTTPGTIVFQVMIGANIVFTTAPIQLNATAHTTLPFELEILLTCRAVGNGNSANLMGQGRAFGVMFTATAAQVDGPNTHAMLMVPATAPGVGAGFDSTTSQVLDFFAGFSISNSGNQVQVQQYSVESMN